MPMALVAMTAEIIGTLVDALPSGSYVVASHLTTEHDPVATSAGQQTMRDAGLVMQKRTLTSSPTWCSPDSTWCRPAWCPAPP